MTLDIISIYPHLLAISTSNKTTPSNQQTLFFPTAKRCELEMTWSRNRLEFFKYFKDFVKQKNEYVITVVQNSFPVIARFLRIPRNVTVIRYDWYLSLVVASSMQITGSAVPTALQRYCKTPGPHLKFM